MIKMIKILIGLVLLILGICFNWKWYHLLESMGGLDYGRSIIQYQIPYLIGALLVIVGSILILKKLLYLSKQRNN